MTRRGHMPVRTCVGCGARDRRGDLLRVVARQTAPAEGATAATALVIDAAGMQPGRGAYLHRNEECWAKFAKRNGTIRSLRTSVPPRGRAALVEDLRAAGSLRG